MTIPELARKAAEQLPEEMVLSEWELEQIEKVVESALNELTAQKDEERNQWAKDQGEVIARLITERDRALADVAEARKDSDRLEWLANHARIEAPRMSAITQKDLRAAIDAARNQQP